MATRHLNLTANPISTPNRALPSLADLLDPDPRASAAPHDSDYPSVWRGELIGESGSAQHATIRLLLSLSFEAGSRLSGDGRGFDFNADTTGRGIPLSVEGQVGEDGCALSLRFWRPAELARGFFTCDGTIDCLQTPSRIDGTWRIGCFMGASCGCAGGAGRFWLRREIEGRRRRP